MMKSLCKTEKRTVNISNKILKQEIKNLLLSELLSSYAKKDMGLVSHISFFL